MSPVVGQHIIYDGAKDKTAQDAVTAAASVGAGSVFDSMLRNMDAQAKREAATALDYARQQMRAKLQNFTLWKSPKDTPPTMIAGQLIPGLCFSIECELETMKAHIESELRPGTVSENEIQQRMEDLKRKEAELDAAIKALNDAEKTKDPLVVRTFELVADNGKDVLDFAGKSANISLSGNALKGVSSGLDEIGKGMEAMLVLYNAVRGILNGEAAVKPDPASLRPPQAKIELELLALDEEHLKTIALIHAKAKIDSAITLAHIDAALNEMRRLGVLTDGARVDTSLTDAVKAADRDRLTGLLDALHEAEAALAQEDLPAKLGLIRESDEARRYSIRRSAVNSSTYDLTIQAASQRLAIYWKSGIKPTDVAALLFYVANTVAVPVIATH